MDAAHHRAEEAGEAVATVRAAAPAETGQLELLYEASQRLNRTLDLDDLYQAVSEYMGLVAPNEGFYISAFDPETRLITCEACWLDGQWLDVAGFPAIPLEDEGNGTQSIVIRTGRALLLNDYQAQQRTARTRYYVDADSGAIDQEDPDDEEDFVRSALIVPLTVGGEVTGVIQVMSYKAGAYNEDQLRLLEALATHISSAMQNAKLYRRVQDELRERTQAEEALALSATRLRDQLHETVKTMSVMVGMRDPYTAEHERRVTRLALAIADDLGLDPDRREGLELAAQVHDIGKVSVPAEILAKPSKLSEIEFTLIKQHAPVGAQILSAIHFQQPVAEIVVQHHERMDGSGYPAGLRADEILPEARILAVADVVEAMASHRPYRAGLGIEAALAEVRAGAGGRYDAGVVAACERVLAGGFDLDARDP
jgi:putative nucleotidyltransferase with HDIG domain